MTHITDEMVADKPSVDEIIQKFKAFVGDNILIGHNIKGLITVFLILSLWP